MRRSRTEQRGLLHARLLTLATLAFAAASAVACVACIPSLDGLTGGDGKEQQPPQPEAGGASASTEDAGAPAPAPAASEDAATVPNVSTPSPGAPAGDAASTAPDAARNIAAGPLVFGAPTSTSAAMGGDSGAPFSEACPPGAALLGLNLVVDSASPFALTQVQGVCAQVALTASGSLAFTSSAPLPAEGDDAGVAGTLQCPAGSVVIGMSASAEKYVHAIVLECAELVTTAGPGGFTVGLAVGTLVGPFGGKGGIPVPAFQCPPPSVASALAGTVGGDGFVDSVALGCATPQQSVAAP
jgi:hypothetical protein